jgi:hypothetical protein
VAVLAAGCGAGGHGTRGSTTSATPATSPTSTAAVAAAGTSTRTSSSVHRGRHRRGGGYGRLPSWLPSAKPPSQKPLHASLKHPKLTPQGEGLAISLPGARLLATAVGPAVPHRGQTPVPATTPVTFLVTFSHVTASVPLRRGSFVLVDELHRIHHPRMTAIDGGAPPAQLRPGPPVSVKLHAVLPAGDGGLEWRPTGTRAIAGWDFTVEID